MTTWEELVASALLGTGRRPPPPPNGPLAVVAGQDPESTLLSLAAALAVTRDAGRRPERDGEPPPEPAPPDGAPRVSEQAATDLGLLLAGEHVAVLGEWLALASATGRRAPEELLPALLDLGRVDALPVLGERGRWLAARNPRWSWVRALVDPEPAWPTADRATHRRILAHLRATNPDQGRSLLAATWRDLAPDERAGLLPLLADNLSTPDVPFLEKARRDRRIDVRVPAAQLLSCLPASPFSTEVAVVAARFVRVGARRLHVSLPAAARDIQPVPARRPPRGRGRGAWLLEHLLAHAPLSTWEVRGTTLTGLVQLAAASEHAAALTSGWATASVRQRGAGWGAALLDAGVDRPDLLSVLAPDEAARLARRRVEGDGITAATLGLLEAVPGDWPTSLGRTVLAALPGAVAPRSVLVAIATRLNPDLAEEAAATLSAMRFAPLVDVLAFRRDIRKELT